jgi:DNA-binding response OmpR family regulator
MDPKPEQVANQLSAACSQKRVLVVADDSRMCELFSALLRKEYDVHVCHDAESALRKVEMFEPHVIVLNAPSPGEMETALARLRTNRRNAAIPLVLVTNASEANWESLQRTGVHVLMKPFHVAELFATIAAIAFGV